MNAGDNCFSESGNLLKGCAEIFQHIWLQHSFLWPDHRYRCAGRNSDGGVHGQKSGQNPDDYWDFAIYAVIFSIIGARHLLCGVCLGLL